MDKLTIEQCEPAATTAPIAVLNVYESDGGSIVLELATRSDAWRAMRATDAAGVPAGFPSLRPCGPHGGWTVRTRAGTVCSAQAILEGA